MINLQDRKSQLCLSKLPDHKVVIKLGIYSPFSNLGDNKINKYINKKEAQKGKKIKRKKGKRNNNM